MNHPNRSRAALIAALEEKNAHLRELHAEMLIALRAAVALLEAEGLGYAIPELYETIDRAAKQERPPADPARSF